jgi:hypothetical protein
MSQTRSLPPLDPDSSQAVLAQIAQEVESGSLDIDNEAGTRLKVIDRILTDVLRWPLAQIKPETHTTSGYADYLLISPEGRALCVLEAKREGAVLVDTVASTRLVCGFDSRFIRPAQDGISQARAYASSTGSRHCALSRKVMPCIVFDNTYHHGQNFQEAVYQYAQMINFMTLSFLIIPITDRTIWRLSKSGVFQSFVSKTFYLPVPSTREVLNRRIMYVRAKVGSKATAKTYFSSKGIRLEVRNIEKFASLLEEIFINTEFVSRLIGWLGNHDLRRSLLIAR